MSTFNVACDMSSNTSPSLHQEKTQTTRNAGFLWQIAPKFYNIRENLREGSDYTITTKIQGDPTGKVLAVDIIKSSGLEELDIKVIKAVQLAKFKPYYENGIAQPIIVVQSFIIRI